VVTESNTLKIDVPQQELCVDIYTPQPYTSKAKGNSYWRFVTSTFFLWM
jgi:hypothetical protein